MTTAATQYGTCQACGRLQKLPGGLLSLHGYTTTFGYFSGTCDGSKERPFEVATDLIARYIAGATAQLGRLDAQIAALQAPATAARTWVYVMTGQYRKRQAIRVWQQVDVQELGTIARYGYTDAKGKTHDLQAPYDLRRTDGDTALTVATHYNRQYASWLAHERRTLEGYITWQQARIAAWTPQPLRDVKPAKAEMDLGAFQPAAPPY